MFFWVSAQIYFITLVLARKRSGRLLPLEPNQNLNTACGVKVASSSYFKVLLEEDIQIAMDIRGRALDSVFIERLWRDVKYELGYLYASNSGKALYQGSASIF